VADPAQEALRRLRELSDPDRLAGMRRYGIATDAALGVTVAELRALARELGRDHDLALRLWGSAIHEARMLASMVDVPALVTEPQMEAWVSDFDSWDLCDQVCSNLFDRTSLAFDKAAEWSRRDEEFVRRAGFTLMATTAVHRKEAPDERFESFLPLIRAGAMDDRNYVKKAVSWALRQIGKRNARLNAAAIETARAIALVDDRTARWVASDVLRELESRAVKDRIAAARAGG
jgi:3-methyladenine DNA glycosylase AlkD